MSVGGIHTYAVTLGSRWRACKKLAVSEIDTWSVLRSGERVLFC